MYEISLLLSFIQITPPGTHIDIINWQSKLANYLSQADADDEEVVEHRMEERKIRGMFNVAFATSAENEIDGTSIIKTKINFY